MAELKDQLKRVLDEATLPFTDEQEQAIILMMEDRRKASEDLFGDLMNFSAGPTQGQEADRLRSAIEWMRGEFSSRLQNFLTPQQLAAWNRFQESSFSTAEATSGGQVPTPRPQNQTQYVRINNNAFTTEDSGYRNFNRGGDRDNVTATEVIQRGGVGAWHGNAQLRMNDEKLNAGRRFAKNKPPYQERQLNMDISGPLLPGRLTSSFAFSQNEAENVDTIRATLADSIFALGITKPTVERSFNVRNTLRLTDQHSLNFNGGYQPNSRENQGVGGFVLPERAYDSKGNNWNLEMRQFSALSPQSIFETRFNLRGNHDETIPRTQGLQINVLDSFSSGGAQNHEENTGRTYEFSSLYSRLGEKLTLKTGIDGVYRKNHSVSEQNFTGTFTFSGLDAYREGQPINYRVNRGNPVLDLSQFEIALIAQNDLKLTSRFTLMYGLRYEIQTNVTDRNNFDPRIGVAYAIGRATVLRGGVGIFHQRTLFNIVELMRRNDGTHQYEIIVDSPSFPDAFQGGTIRNTTQTERITDSDFATPYNLVTQASFERTFFTNLFLSLSYDRSREVHRPRLRNLNAPMDITSPTPASCKPGQSKDTCVRPFPNRGNILNLESTANETANIFRINYRQRFSIFNVSASYSYQSIWLEGNLSGSFGQTNIGAGLAQDGLNSDNYNFKTDWSPILQPVHQINSTVNAQLPLGVFLSGTMQANDGRKYTVTTGKDDNQDNSVNDRPAGEGRNGTDGPNLLNFNFNISKAFFFGDAPQGGGSTRTNVNVFANMTNAFNRPNYNPPSGVMTSSNFGRSTSAGNPREIEVGLRFQF